MKDPLQELDEAIYLLPREYRDRLLPMMVRARDIAGRRKRLVQLVQECLSQLKLDIKYLLFDLECTRKERDEALNEC